MNTFIIIFAAFIVAAVAEPPVSNGGEAIEGSNYVDDALLRRISDILNGGSAGDSGNSQGRGSYSAPSASRQSYNSDPQDTYGPPARSSSSSYNAPSTASQTPKSLGRVILQTPELAPVVAAFELDGGVETKSPKSSYGAPSRNSRGY